MARLQPLKANEIVSVLLELDKNEILGLIESTPLLEAAIAQVLSILHNRQPFRLSLSPSTQRLLPARKAAVDPSPGSNTPVKAGSRVGGVHDDDQQS